MQRHTGLQRKTPLVAHTGLARGGGLQPVGRYGKRNRSADNQTRAVVKIDATCPCGCGRTTGLDWIHLDGRSQKVRHSREFTFAGCRDLHTFIDHTATIENARRYQPDLPEDMPTCKEALRQLAEELGRPLTIAEVWPVLMVYHYNDWLVRTGRARCGPTS